MSNLKRKPVSNELSLIEFLSLAPTLNNAQIERKAVEICETLLLKARLAFQANDCTQHYRFLELEWYYRSSAHDDPYCHARSTQANAACFYFHRAGYKEDAAYRAGTRKGVDITCGSEGSRGGILIRTLQNMESSEVITGPSRLVDHIVRLQASSNIKDMVVNRWQEDISASEGDTKRPYRVYIYFDTASIVTSQIYRSPRVGLDLASVKIEIADRRVEYLGRHYRFLVEPKLLPHATHYTFLALYLSMQESQKEEEMAKTLSSAMKITLKTALSYMTAWQNGRKTNINGWIGVKTVGKAVLCLEMLASWHKHKKLV